MTSVNISIGVHSHRDLREVVDVQLVIKQAAQEMGEKIASVLDAGKIWLW